MSFMGGMYAMLASFQSVGGVIVPTPLAIGCSCVLVLSASSLTIEYSGWWAEGFQLLLDLFFELRLSARRRNEA